MPTALITGASAGLGRALTSSLHRRGWDVIATGRREEPLAAVGAALGHGLHTVPGDITDPGHRDALADQVRERGHLDLLVHNASTIGTSPQPAIAQLTPQVLEDIWQTNVAAPLALTRALLPALRSSRAIVLSISSDAAVEHYEGWGGYAASKAALDHLTLTLGGEEPELVTYAVDPGDMRTKLHQQAFPGEDISDRPEPESVVPGLLQLIRTRPANGRYRAADFTPTGATAATSSTAQVSGGEL